MGRIEANEAGAFRGIMETLFGMQALNWPVTYSSYEAFGKLIVETRQSLNAINLVPRPFSFSSPYKWSRKATRQALIDFYQSADGKPYLYRMKAAALKKRDAFEKARVAAY